MIRQRASVGFHRLSGQARCSDSGEIDHGRVGLLAGGLVTTAVLTLRRRARSGAAAAGLVVLGLGLAGTPWNARPAGAETIGGFCRQAGTFEIRAFPSSAIS